MFKIVQIITLSDKAKEVGGFVVVEQVDTGEFTISIEATNQGTGEKTKIYVPGRGSNPKLFKSFNEIFKVMIENNVEQYTIKHKFIQKSRVLTDDHKEKMQKGRKEATAKAP